MSSLALFKEAGFSTRALSDALAGRGMGMNIVKRAVARMGGGIKVESQAGGLHALQADPAPHQRHHARTAIQDWRAGLRRARGPRD